MERRGDAVLVLGSASSRSLVESVNLAGGNSDRTMLSVVGIS